MQAGEQSNLSPGESPSYCPPPPPLGEGGEAKRRIDISDHVKHKNSRLKR